MKKAYVSPECEIVIIQTRDILSDSNIFDPNDWWTDDY